MVRKAKVADVPAVHALVNSYAEQQKMLPVSLSNLYERLRDFFVFIEEETGAVQGCGALSISWSDLAEIRSLAVRQDLRGKGIGSKIVEACLAEARGLGLQKVFVLTCESAFFTRMGFHVISKDLLPHKVWSVCLNCPKFPDCDETAMMLELS